MKEVNMNMDEDKFRDLKFEIYDLIIECLTEKEAQRLSIKDIMDNIEEMFNRFEGLLYD